MCLIRKVLRRLNGESISAKSLTRCRIPSSVGVGERNQLLHAHKNRCYSQEHIPQDSLCDNKIIEPHVQTCLSGAPTDSSHTGCHVWFLGTGGSLPSKARMTSATMLQLGGLSLLFDAGEGLQRQLMYTRQHISDICKIFITHLHADHILGLFGVLLQMQSAGRSRGSTQHVKVYGPPGIYNFIATTLALTRSTLNYTSIHVYELVGGDSDVLLQQQKQHAKIIYGDFPHLFNYNQNKILVRKSIERNEDGTWTIQQGTAPTHNDDLDKYGDSNRGKTRQINISAAQVKHLDNVQTFGYVVQEVEPPRNIDAAKAMKLGVAPGRKYRKLKYGFSVMSDDGLRKVKPEQVLTGANRKARKVAIIGDTCGLSAAMEKLCKNADVLVHEANSSVKTLKVSVGHELTPLFAS